RMLSKTNFRPWFGESGEAGFAGEELLHHALLDRLLLSDQTLKVLNHIVNVTQCRRYSFLLDQRRKWNAKITNHLRVEVGLCALLPDSFYLWLDGFEVVVKVLTVKIGSWLNSEDGLT